MNKTRRPIVIALAILLTLTLSPAVALAQPLASGTIGNQDQPAKTLTTQAKKKTVYVLAKVTSKTTEAKRKTSDVSTKLSYNKHGLVTHRHTLTNRYPVGADKIHGAIDKYYEYKGINLIKSKREISGIYFPTYKWEFKCKSGIPVSYMKTWPPASMAGSGGDGSGVTVKIARDKKNREIRDGISYKTKNGKTYVIENESNDTKAIYNKHGDLIQNNSYNVIGYEPSYNDKGPWKLSYKSGRLGSKTCKQDGQTTTVKYTYKKMKVPASCAKVIKYQQLELRGNVSYRMLG